MFLYFAILLFSCLIITAGFLQNEKAAFTLTLDGKPRPHLVLSAQQANLTSAGGLSVRNGKNHPLCGSCPQSGRRCRDREPQSMDYGKHRVPADEHGDVHDSGRDVNVPEALVDSSSLAHTRPSLLPLLLLL